MVKIVFSGLVCKRIRHYREEDLSRGGNISTMEPCTYTPLSVKDMHTRAVRAITELLRKKKQNLRRENRQLNNENITMFWKALT